MPVSVVNTIPRVVEQALHPKLKKEDWGVSDITRGRYITLFISVLIILLVYKWADELYGRNAALFAGFLMAMCPNSMANAGLVTTDSYSSLCLLATLYYLWKFCKQPGNKYFLLFCLFASVSQLVKQSLFHIYVFVPLLLLIYYFIKRPDLKFTSLLKYLFLFIVINWLIINAGYYFYGSNQSIGSYRFMSGLFRDVQNILPSWLPVPFPEPFVTGLDMAKYYDQVGGGFEHASSFGKVTILGQSSTGGSFWYYYFVSIFYKTPLPCFIFFGWALFIIIRTRSLKNFIEKEFFLLFPIIYFLMVFSFFYKTQCGLRHIVFIYPLLFIMSSAIIPFAKNNFQKISIVLLSVYLLVSVFFYWRNYYPYTNEFVPDKKMAFAYVGAGNLDFQQGNYFFQSYLQKHPEVHWVTEKPATGLFLIKVDDYLDIWNRHKYDWITGIRPSGVVAHSALLVTVDASDLLHPGLRFEKN